MSKIKQYIYSALEGKYLMNDDAFKNWRFVLFIVMLILLMISSAHSIDRKVMKIAALSKEIRELRAIFVDNRSQLVKIKLESNIKKNVEYLGLEPSRVPPKQIEIVIK